MCNFFSVICQSKFQEMHHALNYYAACITSYERAFPYEYILIYTDIVCVSVLDKL